MTQAWDDATLERLLRAAGDELTDGPEPVALAERVVGQLAAEPAPAPSRLARIRSRVSETARWARGRVGALAAALTILVFGVAVSPVGAQVVDWFDFHGVLVGPERDEPQGSPTVPPAPGGLTVDEAATLVDFRPVVPRVLGEPDAVSVSDDGRLLSMSWGRGADTVRLDQFDGQIRPAFFKASDDARRVDVNLTDALWFPTPHAIHVLTSSGEPATLEPRLAAPTLVWQQGGVTLRLEGHYTEGESVVVAESAD